MKKHLGKLFTVTAIAASLIFCVAAFTACGETKPADPIETYILVTEGSSEFSGAGSGQKTKDSVVYMLELYEDQTYKLTETRDMVMFTFHLPQTVLRFGAFEKGTAVDGETPITLKAPTRVVYNACSTLQGGFNISVDTATATFPVRMPGQQTADTTEEQFNEKYGAEMKFIICEAAEGFPASNRMKLPDAE